MENIVKKKYAYIKEEKVIILLFLNFFYLWNNTSYAK
jgi:hypothetical protein